jgi:hypothetical protein
VTLIAGRLLVLLTFVVGLAGRAQRRRLWERRWARAAVPVQLVVLSITLCAAGTTTLGSVVSTYDSPDVGRVHDQAFASVEIAEPLVDVAPEASSFPSDLARGTPTTPLSRSVATNPAAEAAGWQGKGAYQGVDEWENVTLAKGTRVHAGEPGVSGFFASDSAAASVGHNATALNQGLQIAPRNGMFRPGLTEFELISDVTVGRSIASANPQFGPGGLEQFYIPNWQYVTSPIVSRLMK